MKHGSANGLLMNFFHILLNQYFNKRQCEVGGKEILDIVFRKNVVLDL